MDNLLEKMIDQYETLAEKIRRKISDMEWQLLEEEDDDLLSFRDSNVEVAKDVLQHQINVDKMALRAHTELLTKLKLKV